MADPQITGTTPAGPIVFLPGQTRDVTVNATDPDLTAAPVTQRFRVTDAAGRAAVLDVSLQLTDELSYSADPPPSGWACVQDGTDPAVFHITAP